MEFDWNNAPFQFNGSLKPQLVEESFEDPFAVRLLPDSARFSAQARYFNLGRAAGGAGVFSVFRTNGKMIRVIYTREFTAEEDFFYQRRLEETLKA